MEGEILMKIKVEAYIDFEVDKDELPKDMTIVDVMNTVREDVVEVLKDNYRTEKIKVIAEISEEHEQCPCMNEKSYNCGMKCSRCGREL